MSISPAIFRAYDIRGVVTETLTPPVVHEIGRAFGSECHERGVTSVVVARDGRLSGPELIETLSKGIASTGVNVINIGMVPTPVLYFATYHLKTGTGIMVTGSHNPPEYNGLKMVLEGDALFGDGITALYDRLKAGKLHNGKGSLSEQDVLQDYFDEITGDIKLSRPALGCESTAMFTEVDGNFPNHHPDPAKLENLEDLIKAVKDNQCEVGLAFDGDGDRVGVIDNEGNVIWPDRQMVLFAQDVISRNAGARIIYDVKCSKVLPDAISAAGGVPDMWKTGHSFIKARIKETGALLGGEMSGHIFFKERWYIEAFVKNAKFEGAKLTTIDGVRADFDDGWGLVRASNTTPSLVIRFEADNDAAMERIQNEFRDTMQRTDASIETPF